MKDSVWAGLLGLLVVTVAPTSEALAQRRSSRRPPPPNVITTNPIAALLGGTFNLEFERAVGSAASVFFGPQFQYGLGVLVDTGRTSVTGFGLATGLRFYVVDPAPRGVFLSPQVEMAYVSVGSITGLGYGVGALVGYQWLVADVFAISLGIGGRYYAFDIEGSRGGSSLTSELSGFGVAARVSFGFAFGGDTAGLRAVADPTDPPPTGDRCRIPIPAVQVCQSSQGYRFAIPHPGTCARGSDPLAVITLTCEALDRPAYHACLDASNNWIPVVSWETCASHQWADAPGDFVPPGRAPADGVAPGARPRPAPPPPPAVALDPTLPPRETVRAALAEIQARAGECLPPGAFVMRITFGNDGVARSVEATNEPLPEEVLACFLRHARAVPLPPFSREQLVVTQHFTPRRALPPAPPSP